MRQASTTSARGFTFIELMVSLALGMLVVGAAVKLFSQGVDATWVVSQRSEMQQDLRSVQGMLTKDISLAGAGMPAGQGIALPSGGVSPIYGCDQTGTAAGCPPNGAVNYPCAAGGGCIPTLYGIIPGFTLGITPPGSATKSDLITATYTDSVFALNCYQVSITKNPTTVTFTAPATPVPAGWIPTCVPPPGLAGPQAINDPAVGLTPGDLILFQGKVGANTSYAIGEVTNVVGAKPTYTVSFAAGDPLKMNQSGAANDLSFFAPSPAAPNTIIANRIFVITYYLQVLPDPLGVGAGTPRLMRQVSGHTAVPVAENVINTQYTYDTYAADGTLLNETGDGGASLGVSLNLIRKINITHLTMRSQLAGTRSALMSTSGFQGYDLQTSISARNLNYQNRYTF